MTPEQSLEAHAALKAQTSVAMHFGTFHLADDGQFEPVLRIKLAVDKAPDPKPNFVVLGFGEGRDVPELIQ
jgi:L-ascorbate metabolism protein UlaG (beta-lactamase superfamily)